MKQYSPTQIAMFETCPRRYKFRYIDRIVSEEETIEAFMGKKVHGVLERLYRNLILSKETSMEELLDLYKNRWAATWHKGIRIVKDEYTAENYFNTGKRCIEDYYKRYHPFNQARTLGLELRVVIPIDTEGESTYSMIGYIDRLAYSGSGVYEIHDYKTSSRLPDMAKLEQDRQLPLYQLSVEEVWRDVKEVRLVWHYLAFDKEITAVRSPQDLHLLKEDVKRLIDRIEEEEDFHPIEGPVCEWCEYRTICPLWTHLYKVGGLPDDKYFQEDGVVLANQYAAVTRRMKELEVELKILKSALLRYAKKEGVEMVFGEEYKVRVKVEDKWKFPTKESDTEKREALEDWLRKIEKWQDVSSLNVYALERILKEGGWKEKYLRKLKEYATLEEKASFYLSKRYGRNED